MSFCPVRRSAQGKKILHTRKLICNIEPIKRKGKVKEGKERKKTIKRKGKGRGKKVKRKKQNIETHAHTWRKH